MNNAVKHSACKTISVGLGAVEDEVTLTVKDDGIGFPDTTEPGAGMGLHIMNYRAKMIGGVAGYSPGRGRRDDCDLLVPQRAGGGGAGGRSRRAGPLDAVTRSRRGGLSR